MYYNTCPVCGGRLNINDREGMTCDTCPYYTEYNETERYAIERAEKELEEEE